MATRINRDSRFSHSSSGLSRALWDIAASWWTMYRWRSWNSQSRDAAICHMQYVRDILTFIKNGAELSSSQRQLWLTDCKKNKRTRRQVAQHTSATRNIRLAPSFPFRRDVWANGIWGHRNESMFRGDEQRTKTHFLLCVAFNSCTSVHWVRIQCLHDMAGVDSRIIVWFYLYIFVFCSLLFSNCFALCTRIKRNRPQFGTQTRAHSARHRSPFSNNVARIWRIKIFWKMDGIMRSCRRRTEWEK